MSHVELPCLGRSAYHVIKRPCKGRNQIKGRLRNISLYSYFPLRPLWKEQVLPLSRKNHGSTFLPFKDGEYQARTLDYDRAYRDDKRFTNYIRGEIICKMNLSISQNTQHSLPAQKTPSFIRYASAGLTLADKYPNQTSLHLESIAFKVKFRMPWKLEHHADNNVLFQNE